MDACALVPGDDDPLDQLMHLIRCPADDVAARQRLGQGVDMRPVERADIFGDLHHIVRIRLSFSLQRREARLGHRRMRLN